MTTTTTTTEQLYVEMRPTDRIRLYEKVWAYGRLWVIVEFRRVPRTSPERVVTTLVPLLWDHTIDPDTKTRDTESYVRAPYYVVCPEIFGDNPEEGLFIRRSDVFSA